MIGSFDLLVIGIVGIYVFRRAARWMYSRGWINWKVRRGTSSSLGNAVLGVQTIFQPQTREILEARLAEESEQRESGDPPDPGIPRTRG